MEEKSFFISSALFRKSFIINLRWYSIATKKSWKRNENEENQKDILSSHFFFIFFIFFFQYFLYRMIKFKLKIFSWTLSTHVKFYKNVNWYNVIWLSTSIFFFLLLYLTPHNVLLKYLDETTRKFTLGLVQCLQYSIPQ